MSSTQYNAIISGHPLILGVTPNKNFGFEKKNIVKIKKNIFKLYSEDGFSTKHGGGGGGWQRCWWWGGGGGIGGGGCCGIGG